MCPGPGFGRPHRIEDMGFRPVLAAPRPPRLLEEASLSLHAVCSALRASGLESREVAEIVGHRTADGWSTGNALLTGYFAPMFHIQEQRLLAVERSSSSATTLPACRSARLGRLLL
jgi:hypothetical protein